MSHVFRPVLLASLLAAGLAACNDGGPKFGDAGVSDANRFDSQVVDTDPPDTTIDAAPPALTNQALAHVEFSATEPSSFACTVDGGAAAPCTSPFEITVAEGDHTFSVVATDLAGNVDPTPATAAWTVDLTPPDTTITQHPPALDNSVDVELDFTATETGTFECQVDGGGFAACATPDLLAALADGDHTFDVRAIDPAGNVDPTPATWSWTIDSSTPDTTIDSGPSGATNQTSATFTFSSPNAGAGATFACGLDTTTLTACTSPATYPGLAEGDHTFTVQVTNAAGTSDPTPAQRTWTVDTTAPTVTITTAPPSPTNDDTPTVGFTTAGNPTVIECKVDAGAYAACTSPFTTAALADGPHTVTVRATDAAGNAGTASASFTVDTQPPTVLIDAPTPADPTNLTSATFAFHSADGGTAFSCAIDAGAFASCTTGKGYSGLTGGAGTSHTFHVKATDAAGNTGAEATFTWTIDTQAPTVAIGAPTPANPTNQTSATFSFSSPDATATFACAMDAGAFASCTTGKGYTGLPGGAGTSHTFHVKATDPAGNTGAEATFTWTIDTQAPTATFTSGPIDPTVIATTSTPTFAFTTGGSPTKVQCSVDGGTPATCASPYTTPTLGDGGHTIAVTVTDAAGNTGGTGNRAFTVDTTAPTVSIDAPTPADPTHLTSATFHFSSNDATATFTCKLDTGTPGACTSPLTYSGPLAGGAGTSHTFSVYATDPAGNSSTTKTFTWTIDTSAPHVAIGTPTPANPTHLTSASFNFSSSDGGTSFECEMDAGGFSPGCTTPKSYTGLTGGAGTSHTFHVRATDDAGNTGPEATFTWTIDTQAPNTTITVASEPANPTPVTSASFAFTSNEAGSTFTCQLDTAAPAACDGGTATYPAVAAGTHTFQVFATDAAGNPDATPATYTWVVDTSPPTITQAPPAGWTVSYFPFTFSGPLTGLAYQCNDGSGYVGCSSAFTVKNGVYGATNTFRVRWVDKLGNPSAAATATWIPNQGLVLYYPFDTDSRNYSILEYPDAYDTYDGNRAPTVYGGYAGGAGFFPGGVTLANTPVPLTSGVAYTVSMWVRTDGQDSATPVWSNHGTGAGCTLFVTTSAAAGEIATLTCYDDTNKALGSATAGLSANRWTNLIIKYSGTAHGTGGGGDIGLYHDGNLTGTISNPAKVDVFSSTQSTISNGKFSAPSLLLDELRVYNTVYDDKTQCANVVGGSWSDGQLYCTPPDLGLHYAFDGLGPVPNLGVWQLGLLDLSQTPAPGIAGGSYLFQGTPGFGAGMDKNDHYYEDLTLTAWFDDTAGKGAVFDFSCPGAGCAQGAVGGIYAATQDGNLRVCALTPAQTFCADVPYTLRQWHQLMLASDQYYDAVGLPQTQGIDIYLDGGLAGHLAIAGKGNPWTNTNPNFQVGAGGYSGYIDEVKIWGALLPNLGGDFLCTMGFGGIPDPTNGGCKLP